MAQFIKKNNTTKHDKWKVLNKHNTAMGDVRYHEVSNDFCFFYEKPEGYDGITLETMRAIADFLEERNKEL